MSQLADIRAGLAANLTVLDGVQVSPYVLSNPTPPVLWVRPSADELVTYHEAMRNGLEYWHLVVEAYTGVVSDIGAQKNLDELVASTGATSVKAALEADKQLTKRMLDDKSVLTGQAAAAQDVKVESAHGYAEYARPDGTSLLGCKWNVLVYMQGG